MVQLDAVQQHLLPGLCTEVLASGSAQFEIQEGREEPEMD